jgi:hypothetical protein
LAQHPVTTFLAAKGERIHPASQELASESGHIERECADHDLHCFQAWRKMDEILLANFMVFHDIANEDPYDLWIGDEAWELDYYLHENPEQKRAAYAWLTDFVGWLPMPDGGQHEAFLTADYKYRPDTDPGPFDFTPPARANHRSAPLRMPIATPASRGDRPDRTRRQNSARTALGA